jgi:hypothetical protein
MATRLPRCLLGDDRVLQSDPWATDRGLVTYPEGLYFVVGTPRKSRVASEELNLHNPGVNRE